MECGNCTFRYFDLRYDEKETAALYRNYRGESYYLARHRHEFWYRRKDNDGIGHNADEIKNRKDFVSGMILPHLDNSKIVNVLDYGGDKGQFIPEGIGANKYVYELSDVLPLPGTVKLNDGNIHDHRYDLIMLCHVLEHCSDPSGMLGKIKQLVQGTTFFYFEVPFENYPIPPNWASAAYERYLHIIAGAGTMVVLCDCISTVSRLLLGRFPRWGFAKLHEHINYYNEKSLAELLLREGFRIIACKGDDCKSHSHIARKIGCLASFSKQ